MQFIVPLIAVVLIIATGDLVMALFANAFNLTHAYLQAMGATIAPDKSYNFASTNVAANLLGTTRRPARPLIHLQIHKQPVLTQFQRAITFQSEMLVIIVIHQEC